MPVQSARRCPFKKQLFHHKGHEGRLEVLGQRPKAKGERRKAKGERRKAKGGRIAPEQPLSLLCDLCGYTSLPQASSLKPQASSLKPQASSLKPQASSLKPQASSLK
jgi:hypothetical protein